MCLAWSLCPADQLVFWTVVRLQLQPNLSWLMADFTLINLLCFWCTKANSPHSWDGNISLLAEWEGLVHQPKHSSGTQKRWHLSLPWAQTYRMTLSRMLCLYFPICKNGFMNPQQSTFPKLFTNMQGGHFSSLLLTCLASWAAVGCWM